MSDDKSNNQPDGDPAATGGKPGQPPAKPGQDKSKDADRERCTFMPRESGKSVPAFILERSRADVNVADLELRDGTRVQSVPRWNEQGDRPAFDVWISKS